MANHHASFEDITKPLAKWNFGRNYGGGDNRHLDWSIGVSGELYGLALGVTYVDTNIGETRENVVGTRVVGSGSPFIADETVVFSIGYSF